MLMFILISTGILLAPGPMTMFIMGYAARFGMFKSTFSILGASAAYLILIVLAAIGVGAIVQQSIIIFSIIKWTGVIYLMYLAWKQWNTPFDVIIKDDIKEEPILKSFIKGFIVGGTNPKAIIMFLSVFPQFIDPTSGDLLTEYLVLGAIFIPIQIITTLAYAVLGFGAVIWLKNTIWGKLQPKASALILAIASLWLALGTSRQHV